MKNPLPAGFFFERNDGNDFWVQFKFERLSDFCYVCGLMDHVTGRCKFRDPTLVTSPNGISAKLFGQWLRAENTGSLNFINTPIEDDRRKWVVAVDSGSGSGELAQISKSGHVGAQTGQNHQFKEDINEKQTYTEKEYLKYKEMCPELNSLETTFLRQDVCEVDTLRSAVMEKFRDPRFGTFQLTEWAATVLKEFGVKKDRERRAFDGLDPDLISYIGLGGLTFIKPQEPAVRGESSSTQRNKRPAIYELENGPKRLSVGVNDRAVLESPREQVSIEAEGTLEEQSFNLSQLDISSEETPRKISGENGDQTNHFEQRRPWSWKKEARRRAERNDQFSAREAGESSSRAETRRHLDFQ